MKIFIQFDQMSWPTLNFKIAEMNNKLRYNPSDLKKEELLTLASIVDSYAALIKKTQKQRNYICKKIKGYK